MEKQKNIPILRFPEYKDEWKLTTLGSLLNERNDSTNCDYPLYSLTIESGIVPKTERYQREFLVNDIENAYKVMHKDDFAYNPMNLRFGALARHKEHKLVLVSKYYNIFYCNEYASPAFLEYYLTSEKLIQYYNTMATGSLLEKKRVHYSDFIHFKKYLPYLPEQIKIAEFISKVSAKIDQLQRKKNLLELYKRGMIKQLFSQKLRFKDEDGNYYSKWEVRKFAEIATSNSGKYNPEKDSSSYKCIELEHLASETGKLLGFVDSSNSGSIKNKFEEGDVLFGKLRPYLKKYLKAPFVGVCSSEIWVLKGKLVSNDFLYWIVQTEQFLNLANQSSGSKMPRADWNIISNSVMEVPCFPEQTRIANFLSSIDEKINTCSFQIEKMQIWKKGLLQQMFV